MGAWLHIDGDHFSNETVHMGGPGIVLDDPDFHRGPVLTDEQFAHAIVHNMTQASN